MRYILIFLPVLFFIQAFPQNLPLGYTSYFECNFDNNKIPADVLSSEGAECKIQDETLLLEDKDISDSVLLPSSLILIDNNIFGDFIMLARLKITGEVSDSLSGIYLIAGLRDSSNYYFIQINNNGAGFYRKYNDIVKKIDFDPGFVLPTAEWLNLKVERDILTRRVTLLCGDSKTVFTDANLIMGYIGFGNKELNLYLDKINIWAPTSIKKAAPVFR